jgi:hypothetical protein
MMSRRPNCGQPNLELAKKSDGVIPIFWIGPTERRGLVLGFAAFGEDEIKAAVQQLARAWN